MAAADSSDKQSHDGIDSARIGWAFLSQYYSFLNKDPARLHCFYTKRSTLLHSTEGEDATACYGQQEIHAKIMSLRFEDCKVYISNVDSQSSAEGGIIVQVIGEMSNANGPWRKFAQTFFLAGQHNGYFVLNDICRYIKEEGDEILDAPAAAPAQAEVSADTPVSLPPAASVESVLFEDKSTSQQQVPETEPAAQAGPSAETEQQASADNSFTFHSEALNAAQSPEASQEKEAEGTKEQEAPESEAPQADEAKEPAPAAAGEPPVADRAEAAPAATAAVAAEQRSDEAKPSPAATAEAAAAPTVPAVPATETPAAPPSSTAAPTSPAPAAPATPAAPAAPKSWASLAASNSTKWGKVSSENKGASATTSATASPVERQPAPAVAAASTPKQAPQYNEAVLAVKTPSCFVKGVVEQVTDQLLQDTLTSRFGPLKEMDIVRNKACAFIEFEKLDHARRAIQVSMRPSDGGEGAIFITGEGGSQHRINVVERKPHDQRPVSKRGGGAIGGADRGGFRTAGSPRDGAQDGATRGGRGGAGAGTPRGGGNTPRGGRGGARAGASTSSK